MLSFLPIRSDDHFSSMKRRRQLPPLLAIRVFGAWYLLIELEFSSPLWRPLDLLESVTLGTDQSGTSIIIIDQWEQSITWQGSRSAPYPHWGLLALQPGMGVQKLSGNFDPFFLLILITLASQGKLSIEDSRSNVKSLHCSLFIVFQ